MYIVRRGTQMQAQKWRALIDDRQRPAMRRRDIRVGRSTLFTLQAVRFSPQDAAFLEEAPELRKKTDTS